MRQDINIMKILLVDTGFSSLPIYKFLRQCTDEVWAIGNRAEDVIAKHAGKRWIKQDYSKIHDVAKIIDKFDFIVPGCTDVSMDTCVKITSNNKLLDSVQVNDILNRKSLFRSVCKKLDLPCPRLIDPEDLPLEGKFICKPVDSFSGRGVTIFEGKDIKQFEKAAEIARLSSPSSDFLIESYIEGQLYSCSGFIENESLTDHFFVREGCSANPYAVDTSYVVEAMDKTAESVLVKAIEKLAEHLKLKDGLLHVQFILSDTGPMIIEATRRCPGDLYSLLIERSTGFEYAAKYASYHLGKTFYATSKFSKPIVRHTVTADDVCIFDGLNLKKDILLRAFYPLSMLGSSLQPKQKDRAGILFCEAQNKDSILNIYDYFMQRQIYDVTDPQLM